MPYLIEFPNRDFQVVYQTQTDSKEHWKVWDILPEISGAMCNKNLVQKTQIASCPFWKGNYFLRKKTWMLRWFMKFQLRL